MPESTQKSANEPDSAKLAALTAIAEPIARAHGGEVVDIELRLEKTATKNGWVLRILVERLGAAEKNLSTEEAAVDLDLCAGIARELAPALDAADLIEDAYDLEVGSPGIERELRGERDFGRFKGKKAKLKLSSPVAGSKVFAGILGPVVEGKLTVTDGKRVVEVPITEIVSARLVFEFGPAPKPGKRK